MGKIHLRKRRNLSDELTPLRGAGDQLAQAWTEFMLARGQDQSNPPVGASPTVLPSYHPSMTSAMGKIHLRKRRNLSDGLTPLRGAGDQLAQARTGFMVARGQDQSTLVCRCTPNRSFPPVLPPYHPSMASYMGKIYLQKRRNPSPRGGG